MEDNTKEKGLVKVSDNIFAKIRRFFMLKFGKKQNDFVETKNEEINLDNNNENYDIEKSIKTTETVNSETLNENNKSVEEEYEPKEEIERKLMNYYESIRKCI